MIKQFIIKHRFWVDLVWFILLGQIILSNALPTALQNPNDLPTLDPTSLSVPYSVPLNWHQLNGGFQEFESKELYESVTKMEYWGDNHLLMPIYRALKTGIHLSNLGYNEGFRKTELDPANPMNYKALFSSTWNNMAQILYHIIPNDLKHIRTLEQEKQVAKIIINFRYVLAYIHLLGMILFFVALYKRMGSWYAYGYALLLALNPGIFLSAGNLYNFILYPMFLLAYIVYFAPSLITDYSHKKMSYFVLGFTILNTIFSYFGSLYYLIYTYAPAIATFVAIELIFLYKNWNSSEAPLNSLYHSILRILTLFFVSIIPFIIIFFIEMREMVALYGEEAISLFKSRQKTNSFGTNYLGSTTRITSFKAFLIHFYRYYLSMLNLFCTIPALWIEYFMPKLLLFIPPILLKLKIKYLLIAFCLFLGIYTLKLRNKILPIFIYSGIAVVVYFVWTLGLNLISSVAAYHQHISGYVYATYIDIIIMLLIVKTLYIRAEFTPAKNGKK
ncbi:MAG: hypothetical protein ACRCS8_05410 [Brevinema sp.]